MSPKDYIFNSSQMPSLCVIDSNNNEHILAHKVSLLILKMDNPYLLILATAVIGALVAGFAALSGSYLRKRK